jgi:hypothetical protein
MWSGLFRGFRLKLASTCPIASISQPFSSAAEPSFVARIEVGLSDFLFGPFPALPRRSRPQTARRSPRLQPRATGEQLPSLSALSTSTHHPRRGQPAGVARQLSPDAGSAIRAVNRSSSCERGWRSSLTAGIRGAASIDVRLVTWPVSGQGNDSPPPSVAARPREGRSRTVAEDHSQSDCHGRTPVGRRVSFVISSRMTLQIHVGCRA